MSSRPQSAGPISKLDTSFKFALEVLAPGGVGDKRIFVPGDFVLDPQFLEKFPIAGEIYIEGNEGKTKKFALLCSLIHFMSYFPAIFNILYLSFFILFVFFVNFVVYIFKIRTAC